MNKNNKKTRKERYIENRKKLIGLSAPLRQAVKLGNYNTINEGLKDLYFEENPRITDFNTFNQWKEAGYTIKKGAKAYLFWGQPRKVEQTPEGETEPQEFKYFPLAYLFADTQVYKREPEQQEETQLEKEPEPVSEYDDLPF